MSIYSISDLHLSFGTDKPMYVFGKLWNNYVKLCEMKSSYNNDIIK